MWCGSTCASHSAIASAANASSESCARTPRAVAGPMAGSSCSTRRPATASRGFSAQRRIASTSALTRVSPPAAAAELWPGLCRVIAGLRNTNTAWQGQIGLVRDWYRPLLDRLYDYPAARAGDLDQLEQIAFGYTSRERFLTELTLDPPDASGAEAGRPPVDEDYLILSTIHSAKGQEWDTVFILNLVDGCIPSDMATGKPEQVDEERRLLYVAMTRAREHLYLVQPRRFYRTQQHRHGRSHLLALRSRFLPDDVGVGCGEPEKSLSDNLTKGILRRPSSISRRSL